MTDDEHWKPCPPGLIKQAAQQQKKTFEDPLLTRRATFSVAALLVAGVGSWAMSVGRQHPLSCQQTKSLADKFVRGQLTPELSAAIDAHCRHCQPCERYVQRAKKAVSV